MIPQDLQFPEFVPDQLLTSDNLNDLFKYLDIQDRVSRTNLIGIGIVCGLEIATSDDGTSLTLSRGTGVTSQGYLAAIDESIFTQRIDFNPEKETWYDPFLNPDHTKKFNLWELKQSAAVEGGTPLDLAFLSGNGSDEDRKIVMLFVELLKVSNKNCNPDTCDEKGVNISVNVRPLLIRKEDAVSFGFKVDTSVWKPAKGLKLQAAPIRRFDVPNTYPVTTQDVIKAYQDILNKDFLEKTEELLKKAYETFASYFHKEYENNPFSDLSSLFSGVYDGSMQAEEIIFIQYYYDLFSDLIYGYNELVKTGNEILNECCPEEALFPRHLLLGEATGYKPDVHSEFRYYFIYSPLFQKKGLLSHLRMLLCRLIVQKNAFLIPPPATGKSPDNTDSNIRITPSKHGDLPLSAKAIPYYYDVLYGTPPFYELWNPEKTILGMAQCNLSYHAEKYNSADDFVLNPLHYDLEAYNFLRIEGHVGKNYKHAVSNIKKIIESRRLPADVIAVKTGELKLSNIDFSGMESGMYDLELAYDVARREWEAILGKAIEWMNLNQGRGRMYVDRATQKGEFEKLMKMLLDAKKFLHDNLPPFLQNYGNFIIHYENLEHEAEFIRESLVNYQQKIEDDPDKYFIEDITDQLDEIIHAAKKGVFRNLWQEFNKRMKDVYGYQFLDYYFKKHPGVQHKAGTTMGGTFILVYHNAERKPTGDEVLDKVVSGIEYGTVIADFYLPYTCCSDRIPVQYVIPNELPVAVAGEDFTITYDKESFDLDGSASYDSDGRIESYKWKLISGPEGASLDKTDSAKTSVVFKKPGTYVFGLTVTDDDGGISKEDQISVTVKEPNKPPVADGGRDISFRLPANEVELDGSNSYDPDGTIKSYNWYYKSGPEGSQISNSAEARIRITGLVAGEYIFGLKVTDNEDAVSPEDEVLVQVREANQLPVARAGDDMIIKYDVNSVVLDGRKSTDPDGTLMKYEWRIVRGTEGGKIENAASPEAKGYNLQPGSAIVFGLKVTDNEGAVSAEDEVTVTVEDAPNIRPYVYAGRDSSYLWPIDVILNGTASDGERRPLKSILWEKVSGPDSCSISNPTEPVTTVTQTVPGVYVFRLTATDDRDESSSDEVTITVYSFPVAIASADTTQINITSSIKLDGSASYDNGTKNPLIYQWSFLKRGNLAGNFQNITSPKTTFTPDSAGTYIISLKVTNSQGNSHTDDHLEIVVGPG